MDRAEIERLLGQLEAERQTLQSRLATVTKAADGLQALLEMTPGPSEWPSRAGSDAGQEDQAPEREPQEATPASEPPVGEPPRGMEAVRLILQSDTSRYWNVKEVFDEQVRRGWAQPRERGAKGNPPARAALERLKNQYREHVAVVDSPFLAYMWLPDSSPSPNGSGTLRTEEVRHEEGLSPRRQCLDRGAAGA